jgi:hypothetical protein
MQTYTKNRRRMQLQVESLEGKTLLSTGAVMHELAHHVKAAPIVADATATFSGTLTGQYSDVHVPYFANIQSYVASGTLTGTGSTRLAGTLLVRPSATPGRSFGQLVMHNNGGSMIINISVSGTAGTYTYKVAHAHGNDTAFKGGTGTLMITQSQTFSVSYYSQGQSTMTFTPG